MNPRQLALLSALLHGKVEFAIVGGVAVIAHGYVRMTADLDIFIRPTVENAEATLQTLLKLGLPLQDREPMDLLLDEEHLRFPWEGGHVDILSSIGEMRFEQVWSGRVDVDVDGVIVPFISKADLIENKKATDRYRDWVDVEELEQIESKIEAE